MTKTPQLLAAVALVFAAGAQAQQPFPSRPIRVLSTFTAGSVADGAMRLVGRHPVRPQQRDDMTDELGVGRKIQLRIGIIVPIHRALRPLVRPDLDDDLVHSRPSRSRRRPCDSSIAPRRRTAALLSAACGWPQRPGDSSCPRRIIMNC